MKVVSFQRQEVMTSSHPSVGFYISWIGASKTFPTVARAADVCSKPPAGAPWRLPVSPERGRKLAGSQEEEAERHLGGPGNEVLRRTWTQSLGVGGLETWGRLGSDESGILLFCRRNPDRIPKRFSPSISDSVGISASLDERRRFPS